ncbi:hypothetical protein E2R51_02355 [Jeotgalibacillus sp. S-D1]|uniref:phage tail assembly chaperone G n=1 Tax=Jeotgalibacillus sp. S-D1 TaxID=2552189 RepID=UPI00105AAEB9|nr:hypothetical protein [Jeotgalibacillus sp. S-D1]TDL34579.1 hypothetical protein E2R51_02355 [Jeotgalibacillus sp. S-D1]
MEITLQIIDNETLQAKSKVYSIPFIGAGQLLDLWEFEEGIENEKSLTVKDFKGYARVISNAFLNQFSAEEFLSGVPSYELIPTIRKFIQEAGTNPHADKQGIFEGKNQKTAK